jgi:hypothetical protein
VLGGEVIRNGNAIGLKQSTLSDPVKNASNTNWAGIARRFRDRS